ncbi:MAG: hypothetical protein WA354_24895, partial [Terracidiphilus sp.]
ASHWVGDVSFKWENPRPGLYGESSKITMQLITAVKAGLMGFSKICFRVQDSPIASNGAGMKRAWSLQHLLLFSGVWNRLTGRKMT